MSSVDGSGLGFDNIAFFLLLFFYFFEEIVTLSEIRTSVSLAAVVSLFKKPAGCLSLKQGPVKALMVADGDLDIFSCCTGKWRVRRETCFSKFVILVGEQIWLVIKLTGKPEWERAG